ncbi:AMP-binding enzyme family protein [Aspergillus floccosus]
MTRQVSYVYEKSEPPQEHLITLLDQVADSNPQNCAIASPHQVQIPELRNEGSQEVAPLRWTYRQLQRLSIQLASQLAYYGIRPGDRVAAILYNQAEWALVLWATLRMGCAFVPLDPRMLDQAEDLTYIVGQVRPAAVFVGYAAMAQAMDDVLATSLVTPAMKCIASSDHICEDIATWFSLWDKMTATIAGHVLDPVSLDPKATALIVHTSGSTARPKACPHNSLSFSVAAGWIRETTGLAPDRTICQHLPAFHSYSITFTVAYWLAGGTVVFPAPSFSPAASLRTLDTYNKVHFPCVPSMLEAMIDHLPAEGGLPRPPFSISLGGAAVKVRNLQQAKSLSPTCVIVGYGTTEGFINLLNIIDADSSDSVNAVEGAVACGRTFPGLGVRICATNSRVPLPRGQVGELHQGGLAVFSGYLDDGTATCYEADGCYWFPTGDEAFMDESGYIYILGRYKDLIIRGGENISPLRLEHSLMKVPGVESAQVVGIPDTVAGEVPVAIIMRKSGGDLSIYHIQDTVLQELGSAFVPRLILDLQSDLGKDGYPKTMAGKVHKPTLRNWAAAYAERTFRSISGALDVTAELQRYWSSVSGIPAERIGIDVPVRSLVDSLASIKFCHLASKAFEKRITSRDLSVLDTIQRQAEFFRSKDSIAQSIAKGAANGSSITTNPDRGMDWTQKRATIIPQVKHLGITEADIEDIWPMTDFVQRMTREVETPDRWNVRLTWLVVPGVDHETVRAMLYLWLQRHAMLRTTTVSVEDRKYYLVMRPTARCVNSQVQHGETVADLRGLAGHNLDVGAHWAPVTGPMCKVNVVDVQEPRRIGLIVHIHHAIYDAFVLLQWVKDLKRLLQLGPHPLTAYPYGKFAVDYQQYQTTDASKISVDFHVHRLSGIASCREAIWPPQRTASETGLLTPESTSSPKLQDSKGVGTEAVTRSVDLPTLPQVRKLLGLTTSVIAEAACILFNWHRTGADEAVFATTNLARSWPLTHDRDSATDEVINPLDIDGPTVTYHVERIRRVPEETAMQLLMRVAKISDQLETHCQAPLDQILDALNHLDPVSGVDDVGTIESILERQFFTPLAEQYVEGPDDPIRLLHTTTRAHLGFVWFPYFHSDKRLELSVTFRESLLTEGEVHRVISGYLAVIEWLADSSNLGRSVAECRATE